MDPFNNGSLRPRGLLVDGKFCIQGETIRELQEYIERGRELPLTEYQLRDRDGFDDRYYEPLSDILERLIREYRGIHDDCARHSGMFKDLQHVCLQIIDLSSHAKEDYDPIFANLKKIFKGEGDTDYLRSVVKQDIDRRLDTIRQMETSVGNLLSSISSWEHATAEHQYRLTQIVNDIHHRIENTWLRRERLWIRRPGDPLHMIISPIWKVEDDAEGDAQRSITALEDFQSLHGGWNAVYNDLNSLGDFITRNTRPAPGMMANLEENAILDEWHALEREVRDINDNYLGPAVRAIG